MDSTRVLPSSAAIFHLQWKLLICNQQVIGSNPIAGSLGYQRLTQFEPYHEISHLDTSWTLFCIFPNEHHRGCQSVRNRASRQSADALC
jgi:hypothetical protein